jgi:D-glycero-D-manno-heptose 1,7-bisphosphate phosphatase
VDSRPVRRHAPRSVWPPTHRVRAVVFGAGTLTDTHAGNPFWLRPHQDVVAGLSALRVRGALLAAIVHRPWVGRGDAQMHDIEQSNAMLAELVGPLEVVGVCTHSVSDQCLCRTPAPLLIVTVAQAMQVPLSQCVLVGTSGADIGGARRAGAAALLISGGWAPEFSGGGNRCDAGLIGVVADFTEAISTVMRHL